MAYLRGLIAAPFLLTSAFVIILNLFIDKALTQFAALVAWAGLHIAGKNNPRCGKEMREVEEVINRL